MRKILQLTICLVLLTAGTARAQSDFEKYRQQQKAEFNAYKQQQQEDFKKYRDSLNSEFASFLEKEWKSFNLQKPQPPIKEPIPVPPVYDNTKPEPKPQEVPVVIPPVEPKPEPVKPVIIPEPEPSAVPQKTVNTTFFGTTVGLSKLPVPSIRLGGVSEKEVAQYWKSLAAISYAEMINEALRIKSELKLNDWGLYQLLNSMFKVYFPQGTANEQVVYNVFMLNQLGYRAKIGRNGNELLPLVVFRNEIFNSLYFMYGGNRSDKYCVINPNRKQLSRVETCIIDYADAVNNMDLSLTTSPRFTEHTESKTLEARKDNFVLKYNKNIAAFYESYPCVEFAMYAEAAMDPILQKSIREQLAPAIAGKSQEEAVNLLLNFVQNAFKYKTDNDQYGYEKWNFAEETIESSYSDCEDRSILFAQLVRELLKMPVVLINYPNHLATAVRFGSPATSGDYITVDGNKYIICDPTYTNATLGMSMPSLRNSEVKVIKLK